MISMDISFLLTSILLECNLLSLSIVLLALFSSYYMSTWRRRWHPTPVLLPGKSCGWRSLVGCSPWGREESDMTERLHFHFSLSCIGEGNGNLLQCSCLENPRDGGAWWAAVYGVAQSRTRLKWVSNSSRAKIETVSGRPGAPCTEFETSTSEPLESGQGTAPLISFATFVRCYGDIYLLDLYKLEPVLFHDPCITVKFQLGKTNHTVTWTGMLNIKNCYF